MKTVNIAKRRLWACLVFYLVTFALYLLTSYGIDRSDILLTSRQFLIPTILLLLLQGIRQEHLFNKKGLRVFFIGYVGVFWGLILPSLKRLFEGAAYVGTKVEVNTSYEILFGMYLFLFFYASFYFIRNKVARIAYLLFSLLLVAIPLADVWHLAAYGRLLDKATMIGVWHSTAAQHLAWLESNFSGPLLLAFLVFLVFVFWVVDWALIEPEPKQVLSWKRATMLFNLSVILILCLVSIGSKTWEIGSYRQARSYIHQERRAFLKEEKEEPGAVQQGVYLLGDFLTK